MRARIPSFLVLDDQTCQRVQYPETFLYLSKIYFLRASAPCTLLSAKGTTCVHPICSGIYDRSKNRCSNEVI